MMTKSFFCVLPLAMVVALVARTSAQVQTEVPPVVTGAKAMTVERAQLGSDFHCRD